MSGLKSGELFAGVGGLGMAVDDVFGSDPAWFCEFDAAPSRVLAHHFPDVPNYGDVTKVDWGTAPHVDILAGGFPCQDVSLAGARRGMKDGTRSGLWSEYVKAIDTLRPDWVVIENVRGLISAQADSEVEPCPWCVGDGDDEYHLRALDAVLADLSRLGFDAEWTGLRAADVGAPHGRFRFFILAWPTERTTAVNAARVTGGRGADARAAGRRAWFEFATDTDDRARNGEWARAGSRDGGAEAGLTLLPTPRATDGPKGAVSRSTTTDRRVLEGRANLSEVAVSALLPTPDYGQPPQVRRAGGHSVSTADAARGISDAGGSWGAYAAAIARWESVMLRPAPAPVRMDGRGGKARLNPELTEWMMGWPAGWVTASAQLSRAEQLKACGNGVVPQQAAAALRMLLARPGVPAVRSAVAA